MTAKESSNAIRCPQCGGENELLSGSRLLRCTFCDATLFVDRGGVVQHYRLPPLLSVDEAKAALRRWMAGNSTVKDLDRKSTLQSFEAVAFPMWLFRAQRGNQEEVHVEPAAPTPIPQLADLEVPAGRLQPYSPGADSEEDVAASVPLETARKWLTERGVNEVTETALVRVPLWRARYDFSGKRYEALVDASTGAIIAAIYPEKAEAPYAL